MAAPKKRMNLEERLRFYAEQARQRQEEQAAEAATAATISTLKPSRTPAKSTRIRKRGRYRRRQEPPPVHHHPCRIYFWQQAEGEAIKIGRTSDRYGQILRKMRGPDDARAHLLSVIDADTQREAAIHQQFAAARIEGQTNFYQPTAELLQLIAAEATPWVPPVPETSPSDKPRPRSKMVQKVCECGAKFRTGLGDRYCKECRKEKRKELDESGYLQRLPRKTMIKPENRGADRDSQGDPSPWNENAVRSLEGD